MVLLNAYYVLYWTCEELQLELKEEKPDSFPIRQCDYSLFVAVVFMVVWANRV